MCTFMLIYTYNYDNVCVLYVNDVYFYINVCVLLY